MCAPHTLDGLAPLCFQEPLDKKMLDVLKSVPGVDVLVKKVLDYVVKNARFKYAQGKGVIVSENSDPGFYELYLDVCKCLRVPKPYPELFVIPDAAINASTIGTREQCIIEINRGVISFCPESVQRFILGHELGHCLCDHVLYHAVATILAGGKKVSLPTSLLTSPLQALRVLFMEWARSSEISADRAGLLACQDFDVACTAFLLMEGHPFKEIKNPEEALQRQAQLYNESYKGFWLGKRLLEAVKYTFSATHPFHPIRYLCLKEWLEMGFYGELLSATSEERQKIAKALCNDSQMHTLYHAVLNEVADYFVNQGLEPKKVFPLLHKAFFFDETLKNTILQRLLQVKVNIRKQYTGFMNMKVEMKYELEMLVCQPSEVKKITIDMGDVFMSRDWSYCPKEIREKMIEHQSDAESCVLYNVEDTGMSCSRQTH